jgi:nicotinamidase-related amidase
MSIPDLGEVILMTSASLRDPVAGHLITPQNAALVLIDDQPAQFATVRSMDPELLLNNIVSRVNTAKTFGLLIVHSTVNVASGQERPTVPELQEGT